MADAKLLIEEVPTDRLKSIVDNQKYETDIIDIAGNYSAYLSFKQRVNAVDSVIHILLVCAVEYIKVAQQNKLR